jgi:hypothetical protein
MSKAPAKQLCDAEFCQLFTIHEQPLFNYSVSQRRNVDKKIEKNEIFLTFLSL